MKCCMCGVNLEYNYCHLVDRGLVFCSIECLQENDVDVGEDGDNDAGDSANHQADDSAALGSVLLIIENGRQYIGNAEQEGLQLSGIHGTGALEDDLQQNLDGDDFQRADGAEYKAADELRQGREVQLSKGRERRRDAHVHQNKSDGAHHASDGEGTDSGFAFHRHTS